MVGVETREKAGMGEVVVDGGVVETEGTNGIGSATGVELSAAKGERTYFGTDAHGVAREGETDIGIADVGTVHADAPFGGGGCGVFLGGVAESYIEVGVAQPGKVDVDEFVFPIHAVKGCGEFAGCSFNVGV